MLEGLFTNGISHCWRGCVLPTRKVIIIEVVFALADVRPGFSVAIQFGTFSPSTQNDTIHENVASLVSKTQQT
jgi:hypothetical protein